MSTPARYLLGGQIGFAAFLALCAFIDPTGLGANHGWSYYVGRDETLVPYLLAFSTFIALTLVRRASSMTPRRPADCREVFGAFRSS